MNKLIDNDSLKMDALMKPSKTKKSAKNRKRAGIPDMEGK